MSRFDPFTLIDVPYQFINDHPLQATLLIPNTLFSPLAPEEPRNRPVIVRFHGGGFIVGHRTYEPWFAQWLLDLAQGHEAIIITPDYRLLPESNGADILSDIAHFWQWMQTSLLDFASQSDWPFSLDLTRTLCCGESAGGYLAVYSALHLPSMISVTTNTAIAEEKQENASVIVDIRAVISISAPLDTNAPELRVPRPRTFIGTRPPPPREAEARIRTYIKNIPPGAIRTGSEPTAEMWELVLCVSQQSYLPRLFGVKGNGQKAALSGIMESLEKWKEERREGLPALWVVHGSGDTMVDDLNRRFTFPSNHFDLVHSRLLATGINRARWPSYLADIKRVLKPGGWVQLIEIYFNVQSDNGSITEEHALRRWSTQFLRSYEGTKDVRVGTRLNNLLRDGGFKEIDARMIPLPLSAWSIDRKMQEIGMLNRDNVNNLLPSLALYPLTQISGMPQQDFQELITQAREEAETTSLKAYFPFTITFQENTETRLDTRR
ncbi:hypothetical protein CNMCM5623_008218 [Aspergillus felis]|uniref:Alpha/beta hydrolase fold-3 domain-containing protein n=1 Tax=Aspergillus felis TaxID=1287682 RepID=A0A8H6PYP4_9EURO|nr:hypothetical protein CNMCM5623_008218 [Aspergillus felis]KAF7176881.1 hypothetical protein CNMCM7691_004165 [Aspergillus felis]